jgi:hypothetical protein
MDHIEKILFPDSLGLIECGPGVGGGRSGALLVRKQHAGDAVAYRVSRAAVIAPERPIEYLAALSIFEVEAVGARCVAVDVTMESGEPLFTSDIEREVFGSTSRAANPIQ